MIHICFGIHDENGKYTKYMATAMCSIMRNTHKRVTFHIFHDHTLKVELQSKLKSMTRSLKEADIEFYKVDIDEKKFEQYNLKRFTVGTLYKLMICDRLADITDRIIYLDSDIIVNLDIVELWQQDLYGKKIGAVCLPPKDKSIFPLLSKGIIGENEYFNTGVMLLDVKEINKTHHMWDECIAFVLHKPELWRAPDQDAITYIFRGEIYQLPSVYNIKASEYRKTGGTEKCVFHFIADRPLDTLEFLPDRLFLKSFRMTPWGTDNFILEHYGKRIKEKDEQKEAVYRLLKAVYSDKKKIFWGIRGDIHDEIMNRIPWKEGDYFVDSNKAHWGKFHKAGKVFAPDVIKKEDSNNTIVIVTVFRYNEIKPKLESFGYKENVNFFNGKYLLPEEMTYTLNGERENKWDL